MMKKMLSALICVFVVVALFAGCSGVESDIPAENDPPIATASPLSMAWPTANSIEGYHNFLLAARAYANEGIMPYVVRGMYLGGFRNTIRDRAFGDMERYYMPSWLPEGFTLNHIRISSESVGVHFYIYDFDRSQFYVHEYILNNQINFSWSKWQPPYSENLLNNEIQALGLRPAVGAVGLYYYDFAALCDPSVNLRRSYHWIQDGYFFRLSIPLWIIEEHGHPNDGFGAGGAGAALGDSIADLVMGSALAVELVDGQQYVPPTGIEIIGVRTDIAVGEALALTANVSPENATIDAVIWSSSDNRVAIVTQDGVVTRVGEGNTTISARTLDGSLTATFLLREQ